MDLLKNSTNKIKDFLNFYNPYKKWAGPSYLRIRPGKVRRIRKRTDMEALLGFIMNEGSAYLSYVETCLNLKDPQSNISEMLNRLEKKAVIEIEEHQDLITGDQDPFIRFNHSFSSAK
jgi:hypothetical protein